MKKISLYLIFTLATILVLPMITEAQDAVKNQANRKNMHRELPDDKYMAGANDNALTSPAYTKEGTLYFTTQVNVNDDGNNIVNDAANEPSIAIDPTNPNRMVIGWRQFDNINSNFRQAGYGYTSDAGQTWTFPGVINPGVFRSDPVLDCNSEGTFFYNSLTVDDVGNYTCNVYRNEPGTFNWDNGVLAHGGDKQWMVIDRTGGMGEGHVYSFWTSYYTSCDPGSFTRSVDGGDYYEDCEFVTGNPYWGTMDVGPNGELYIAGTGEWDGIGVSKSINAQDPSNPVYFEQYTQVDVDGYLTGWTPINPSGIMGQAYVSVDKSGGSGNGNVYVLASVARNSNGDPADVMFARSTDGGSTWSAPVRINDDPGTNDYQWFGTLSVAPNGRIDVVWLDTRDDPSGNTMSALYYSYSMDQGFTWTANEKLSDIFDPHVGWPQQEKMGDYFEMESDAGNAHLAWCNTLNGEQDVYYTRITPQITAVDENKAKEGFCSLTNYPNPFIDQTTVRYVLPESSQVKLVLYDVCGKEIRTLKHEFQSEGTHNLTIIADDLPYGISYCRLVTDYNSETISLSRLK